MISTETRLFAVMESVVPRSSRLTAAAPDCELAELGFDSMALIALFVELESEFDLSVQELSHCLHRRCTVNGLLDLCRAQRVSAQI